LPRPSGLRAIGKDTPGFPLQDSDEVDCPQIVIVLIPLGIGELSLIALVGEFIDLRLIAGIGPKLDDLPGIIQGHRVTHRLEHPVKNGSGLGLVHGLILSIVEHTLVALYQSKSSRKLQKRKAMHCKFNGGADAMPDFALSRCNRINPPNNKMLVALARDRILDYCTRRYRKS
jgi:hypothetical protein